MYSGTTIHTKSGRIMGAHQRIDRIARRHITRRVPSTVTFPGIRQILHFEGANGPDGIKRKSPGVDEPWHFIDPYHEGDHQLFEMIEHHIVNLSVALRESNQERAAFEAAWLSHAVVDGLTPAHHYPFEEKLHELRGEGMHTRNSKRSKLVMPGKTRRHQIRNNWEFWGAKGVMTTHIAFEFGVSSMMSAQRRYDEARITDQDVAALEEKGYEAVYREILVEIAELKLYEEFMRTGWSRSLAKQTKERLLPRIISAVELSWYDAVRRAEQTS